MKRIIIFFLIIISFFVGIKIGSSSEYNGHVPNLFEEEKEKFENEIILPNNEYENKELIPKEYLPNKVANIIDKLIDKIIQKLT